MSVLSGNLQRIQNILNGDATAKSKVSVGYDRSNRKRKEGEVWEEAGKTWTIKNGLKQTVTKLDSARQATNVPWACPNCNKPLKHYLDVRAYKATQTCYDCVVAREGLMKLNGTFSDYSKDLYKTNALSWLEDKRQQFEDFLANQSNKGFVTQNGEVEDWHGSIDEKTLREQFEKEYNELKEKIENL